MKRNTQKRVVVGMSGGVDSSVSALLLKQQGYEVIGLFMQNWDSYVNNDLKGHTNDNANQCNAQKDFADAKAVADKLGIKIYRTEFINRYWKQVFQYMVKEYKKGRTPNPDILCNKYIKFKEFIDYAKKRFNCTQIAMGHYANVKKVGGSYQLLKAADENKDQTYFLCWLNQDQLKNTLFPIGKLTKVEVRQLAKKYKFDNWSRKDSTGICFIGERKFKDFLNNYLPFKKGKTIDAQTGKQVGTHDGVVFFTYGQNKGLGLSGQTKKYYVCGKNIKANILYVCDELNKNKYLLSSKCEVTNFNWINEIPETKKIKIRFRHRQALISGGFVISKNKVFLSYKPTLSITPGQFAVLYQGKKCLGGGIINRLF